MLLETLIHFYVCEMDIDVYLFIIQFSQFSQFFYPCKSSLILQEYSKAYYILYYFLMTVTCYYFLF